MRFHVVLLNFKNSISLSLNADLALPSDFMIRLIIRAQEQQQKCRMSLANNKNNRQLISLFHNDFKIKYYCHVEAFEIYNIFGCVVYHN